MIAGPAGAPARRQTCHGIQQTGWRSDPWRPGKRADILARFHFEM